MTDRTQVMQKIINLRAMAESSSSENEAMQAMKIAEKMMRGYRIEEAELALAEGMGEIKVEIEDFRCEEGFTGQGRNRHKVQSVIWDLADYCEVKATVNRYSQTYRVIGDKPDVELFNYLITMLKDALDREYENWKRTQQAVGRGAKPAFQLGMAERINQRLRDMSYQRKNDRRDAEQAAAKMLNCDPEDIRMAVNNANMDMLTSTALVVASAAEQKKKAVDEAYRSAYKNVRLGTSSGFGYRGGSSAGSAGRAAGGRVGLGRPVGGASAKRLS